MIVVSHFTLTKHTSYVIQTDILCYKRALKKLNNIITCAADHYGFKWVDTSKAIHIP